MVCAMQAVQHLVFAAVLGSEPFFARLGVPCAHKHSNLKTAHNQATSSQHVATIPLNAWFGKTLASGLQGHYVQRNLYDGRHAHVRWDVVQGASCYNILRLVCPVGHYVPPLVTGDPVQGQAQARWVIGSPPVLVVHPVATAAYSCNHSCRSIGTSRQWSRYRTGGRQVYRRRRIQARSTRGSSLVATSTQTLMEVV